MVKITESTAYEWSGRSGVCSSCEWEYSPAGGCFAFGSLNRSHSGKALIWGLEKFRIAKIWAVPIARVEAFLWCTIQKVKLEIYGLTLAARCAYVRRGVG